MAKWYDSRKIGNRKAKKILVIVCEGQTECTYFNSYKERKSGLRIETLNCTATDPQNLMNFALKQKHELDDEDDVWCVFDLDNSTNEAIQRAIKLAEDKIKVCLSNPCFELWYLLHFEYLDRNISTKDVQNKLEKHIKSYDKSKDYFKDILFKIDVAIKNAKKLNLKHETSKTELLSVKSNPSTQVFQLVEHILETIKQNKK